MREPDSASFAQAYDAGLPQAVFVRHVADLETPVSAFLKLGFTPEGGGRENAFLLESVQGGETRARYSIIGLKPDLIWRTRGDLAEINRHALNGKAVFETLPQKPLESLRTLIAETKMTLPDGLPPMAVGLFGYLGYDMARQVEHLPNPPPDTLGLPDAILLRPTILAIFDAVKDEILIVTPVWPDKTIDARTAYARATARLDETLAELDKPLPASMPAADMSGDMPVGDIQSNMTKDEYFAVVARAKEYIAAGDVFQVVPSQRFRRAFTLPPFALYRALRRLNPSPFLYYLAMPGFQIVGSSPEVLVRLRDGKVTIRPIAGTRPRGKTAEQDKALADELMGDPKERAEHLMLVDLGRNDVGRVSKVGQVEVTGSFFIERYSHVMHLVSNVEGALRDGLDAVDALAAGLPAGTLSGAPKIRAMEIIDEFEKEKRGAAYAGAVGYFAADGSMDTCIVLRTALVKDGVMYVQAGGGVVADSEPEAEYQETVNKARALMAAAEEAARFASVKKGQ